MQFALGLSIGDYCMHRWVHFGDTILHTCDTARPLATGTAIPKQRNQQCVRDGCGQHCWVAKVAQSTTRAAGGTSTHHILKIVKNSFNRFPYPKTVAPAYNQTFGMSAGMIAFTSSQCL